MKIPCLFFLVVVSLWPAFSLIAKNHLQVEDAVFDLNKVKLDEGSSIKLQGDWGFYWKHLLEPEDFIKGENLPEPDFVKVPKSWTSYTLNNEEKLPNKGFATYRLKIEKKPDEQETI